MDPILQSILILLAIVSGLTVLVVCPSRAGMWRLGRDWRRGNG